MSTRIHHGHIFASESLEEVLELTNAWRPELTRLRLEHDARHLAFEATQEADRRLFDIGEWDSSSPLSRAYRDMRDRRKKLKEGGRDPDVDIDFQFTAHPHEGTIYALPFTEHSTFLDSWRTALQATAFPYWDQSDGPDEISYEDWKARGDLWERVLKDLPPAETGVVFEFPHLFLSPPENEDIVKCAPSFEKRAFGIARTLFLNKRLPELGKDFAMSAFSRLYMEISEDLQGETPSTQAQDILESVKEKLPREVTLEFLRASI